MKEQIKLFYETFPPTILSQIVCLVENGTITHNTGKLLLYSYIDTHKAIIDGIFRGILLDYNETLDYFIARNFPK